MKRSPLSDHEFTQGFVDGPPALNRSLENTYAIGSRNQIMQGDGFTLPWQGLAGQGDNTGSRLMRQILQTYGGLQDYFIGILRVEGRGSFFSDIGKSLWFIGGGRPNIEGDRVAEGVFASTELQVSIAVNGIYSASTTFDAGMPQSSAPDIGIISTPGFGFTGLIEGPISCKISRLRLTTGARSVASKTSAVVNPQKKTVRVTFPLPSQGQDFWAVFFTQSGFGGVGLHYRVAYQDSLDISEATVAAGIIDGIPRSLEFDFKDGDLVPEEAYIDDYPPPAGTHAVRLANVMCVLGAYGDSTAPVTSTDPGTVGAISLPNFYESYKPRNLVYFPEQIVDVLARPSDEYAYVGHRNCITALQALGGVMDGPAVAVSMVWPDIGIAKPHNWCQVHGLLYTFQAKGGPVRMMPDGSPDYSFAAPVRRYMRDWTVEDTIVGSHPDSLSVVYFNGREALSWSLQAQKWSPPCFFEDVCVEDSPIPSSSPSASLSPSASISASPSSSFSASPSASPSASVSSSPSSSISASPSSSLSASPSATPSSSVSASPSSSVSSSVSSSPSNSGSSSPSPSASPSSSLSASPSSSPSGSGPDGPDSITNLELWLDGSQIGGLGNGDEISTWNDESGNSRNATGVVDNTRKPTFRSSDGPNSTPCVRLVNNADSDKGGHFTLPDFLTGFTAGHAFWVVKNDLAGDNSAPIMADFGSDLAGDLYAFSDNRIFSAWGSTVRKDCGNGYLGTHSIIVWHLFEIRCAAGAWSAHLDGDQIFSTGTNTVGWGTAPFIGRRSAGGGAFTRALVAEAFMYSRVLNGTEITTVKAYITDKYALTLA